MKNNYLDRAKRFRAKKRLGQNFLVDGAVIDSIIEAADITQDDTMIEIGTEAGFVTEKLAQKAKKFKKVTKAAFGTRRKNIKNALVSGGFKRERVAYVLQKLGKDPNTRGEKLYREDFARLADVFA